MKVFPLLALTFSLMGGVAAYAADPAPAPAPAPVPAAKIARKPLTADQKALIKEITAKYDTNKDGKLSREERAKISAEDQAKMEKAGLPVGGKKGKAKAPAADK
jgi:hypothetical protein